MPDFPAGWPRPFLDRLNDDDKRVKTPALWIGGEKQARGDWLTFDESRAIEARKTPLCVVCGLSLNRTIILGHVGTYTTDGPPAHPRCFAMALRFCPRFSKGRYANARQTVAYAHNLDPEDPLGWMSGRVWQDWSMASIRRGTVRAIRRRQMIELAKRDPLGLDSYPFNR